jgi:hypothetical protein
MVAIAQNISITSSLQQFSGRQHGYICGLLATAVDLVYYWWEKKRGSVEEGFE